MANKIIIFDYRSEHCLMAPEHVQCFMFHVRKQGSERPSHCRDRTVGASQPTPNSQIPACGDMIPSSSSSFRGPLKDCDASEG